MARFKCLNCKDSCCSRRVVALTACDLRLLASNLSGNVFDWVMFRGDMPSAPMVKGQKLEGALTLKQIDGSCIFLKDNLCSVHDFRPLACQMYPFDPLVIEKVSGYDIKIRMVEDCPGLGQGKRIPDAYIMRLANRWRKARLEYDDIVRIWNEFKQEEQDLVAFVREAVLA